jgi:hypothetical protein
LPQVYVFLKKMHADIYYAIILDYVPCASYLSTFLFCTVIFRAWLQFYCVHAFKTTFKALVEMAITACLVIVSKNDIPTSEAEVGSAPKVHGSFNSFPLLSVSYLLRFLSLMLVLFIFSHSPELY